MVNPNFLIVGAAKSGTTALIEYLSQHPEIFITEPKEPHYFAFTGESLRFRGPGDRVSINRRAVTDPAKYRALYEGVRNTQAAGEGSVSYLYYAEAVNRIKREAPDCKIICLLRHPADRAYSAYCYMTSLGLEPCEDFDAALQDEERRIAENWHHIWHYRRMGQYAEQLQRYFSTFPKSQVRVYLYEDFRNRPKEVLHDCFKFLEVDSAFTPARTPAPLVSGIPRSRFIQSRLTHLRLLKDIAKPIVPKRILDRFQERLLIATTKKAPIPSRVRRALVADYRADITKLQELLERDLSHWLADTPV